MSFADNHFNSEKVYGVSPQRKVMQPEHAPQRQPQQRASLLDNEFHGENLFQQLAALQKLPRAAAGVEPHWPVRQSRPNTKYGSELSQGSGSGSTITYVSELSQGSGSGSASTYGSELSQGSGLGRTITSPPTEGLNRWSRSSSFSGTEGDQQVHAAYLQTLAPPEDELPQLTGLRWCSDLKSDGNKSDEDKSDEVETNSDGTARESRQEPEWHEGDLTVKLANLPRRCSEEEVLAAINAAGFAGQYDFFVLPRGPMSKQNHGYAFLNLKETETVQRFREVIPNFCVRSKPLIVRPSPIQGLEKHLARFKTNFHLCSL